MEHWICLQHRLREQVKKEQQFKTFSGSENTVKLPNDIVSKCIDLFCISYSNWYPP